MKKGLLFFCLVLGCSSQHYWYRDLSQSLLMSSTPKTRNILIKKEVVLHEKYYVESEYKLIKVGKDKINNIIFLLGHEKELEDFTIIIRHQDGKTEKYGLEILSNKKLDEFTNTKLFFLKDEIEIVENDVLEYEVNTKCLFPQLGLHYTVPNENIEKIEYRILLEKPYNLKYHVYNDTIRPSIREGAENVEYTFSWENIKKRSIRIDSDKASTTTHLAATSNIFYDNKDSINYVDFGDWYLDLIRYSNKELPDKNIKIIADSLTKGLTFPKQKVDSIFNFTKQHIRYAQNYYEYGEIIPNSTTSILTRKYGDCKDFAYLFYSFCKSIGVGINLALVNTQFKQNIDSGVPLSMFNHMICAYMLDNKYYWYDPTSIANQPGMLPKWSSCKTALVLKDKNSRLVKLGQNKDNLLKIKGNLSLNDKNIAGKIDITLFGQYETDFIYPNRIFNNNDKYRFYKKWIKDYLNNELVVEDLKLIDNSNPLVLSLSVSIPNCYIYIDNYYHFNLSKIFPNLIDCIINDDLNEFNSSEKYECFEVDLEFIGLYSYEIKGNLIKKRIDLNTCMEQDSIENNRIREQIKKELKKSYKFIKGEK